MNRSALFSTYNMARGMANAGALDGPRLNRALGIAQRNKAPEYETTATTCSCKDFMYRGGKVGACKHILALLLRQAA